MGFGAKKETALIEEHRIILVSPTTYHEIWEQLAAGGYDYLIWPDNGRIPMDGFIIMARESVR